MVMQQTGYFWVGGSDPGRVNVPPPPPPPPRVGPPGFEPPTKNLRLDAVPFNHQLCVRSMLPHCLEPSERKLLTPPHPALKKVISSFRG